jgi:quercetin dioxygenase-like cupin family protein
MLSNNTARHVEEFEGVCVVHRQDISAITEIVENGRTISLGEHRGFRRNEILNSFMDNTQRCSMSWVKLKGGEFLANHRHPTRSMIIVCKGNATLTGEVEQTLNEGDVVIVPEGRLHGFKTILGDEFHGISVQFEGDGLYEDENNARVSFEGSEANFDTLKKVNEELLQRHLNNKLFKLFKTDELRKQSNKRDLFYSALHVWSVYFQRMIHARQALCFNDDLKEIYTQHMLEEIGHDRLLAEKIESNIKTYDPILEAACTWFLSRMYSSDEVEKVVIIHMVVESSGHEFGHESKRALAEHDTDGYFVVHAEADEDHSQMGMDQLENLSTKKYEKLIAVCREAWDQMDLIHDRITELCLVK